MRGMVRLGSASPSICIPVACFAPTLAPTVPSCQAKGLLIFCMACSVLLLPAYANPKQHCCLIVVSLSAAFLAENNRRSPPRSNLSTCRSVVAGFVEEGDVNAFQFEDQRRTFETRGYAHDPSVDERSAGAMQKYVGDHKKATAAQGETQATSKRKRDDPWERFKDELLVAKPSEEDIEKMAEWAIKKDIDGDVLGLHAKKVAAGQGPDSVGGESKQKKGAERSTLHIAEEYDYQGRTYMHPDQTLGITTDEPERCFLPKREIHSYVGHTKGVSTCRYLPKTAHLLLSAGLDSKIKIWEVHGGRRMLRTYHGHTKGVKDIDFNNSGSEFVSGGFDRMCRLWDTETGQCKGRFATKREPFCIKMHPAEDKQNLFVVGTHDKKILCFDTYVKNEFNPFPPGYS